MVEASGTAGSFCKVEAYVYPQVGIEIHLPLAKDWNGKLITTGNGGWAGSIFSHGLRSASEARLCMRDHRYRASGR